MGKQLENGNFIRLLVIMFLVFLFLLGNIDITQDSTSLAVEGGEGEAETPTDVFVPTLTQISNGSFTNSPKSVVSDFIVFCKDFKKTKLLAIDKELRNETLPNINNLNDRLRELKEREMQLQTAINAIPTDEYKHSKMELSSFMVEELKKEGLIYEIEYNYTKEEPKEKDSKKSKSKDKEPETIGYTNTYRIKVYRINEGDNYQRLTRVLNNIFIREPYDIESLQLEFNELTRSYSLSFVVGV